MSHFPSPSFCILTKMATWYMEPRTQPAQSELSNFEPHTFGAKACLKPSPRILGLGKSSGNWVEETKPKPLRRAARMEELEPGSGSSRVPLNHRALDAAHAIARGQERMSGSS